jgi:predicted aspartyl protease
MTVGLTFVDVSLTAFRTVSAVFADSFLVDTGATDSMAPASALRGAGIEPTGRSSYQLENGGWREYDFALVQIEFLGEVTAGRVLFGPDDIPPLLGATALESAGFGFVVDPVNQRLTRLPAIPMF